MRKPLCIVPALLLLTVFASSIRADGLLPVEIVNATVFFVPLADNFENTHSSFVFVDYQLGGDQETVGVACSLDPFTISNGQMTFIPGLYDPNGNTLSIEPSGLPGGDNFSILSGFFTFVLPSTVTPTLGVEAEGPFYELDNVPLTVSSVPEPATFFLIGIGFLFVMGKRIARRLLQGRT
ncbi:MAG TPA: PEP-CTERM sorting domain-containing protein [Candidatus Acidoferrum sp.]|nr:PEP-CTERM sorting domain-containing protein [Candidatus Acidoferrum sp.]